MMSQQLVAVTVASTSAMEEKKMITLVSKEQDKFVIEARLALQSLTLKECIEDEKLAGKVISIFNVKSRALAKVIEYWKYHADDNDNRQAISLERKKFDAQWVNVDQEMLFELLMAANYLNSTPMLELTCQAVADEIKDMSIEQVREYFGIENDFTEEEEELIQKENKWAFE